MAKKSKTTKKERKNETKQTEKIEKEFNKNYTWEDIKYNLNLKLTKSKIIMTFNSLDDYISLYDNYAEITYSEFLNLGKCFKSCSNLDEIFNLLKNVLKGLYLNIKKDEYVNKIIYSSNGIYESRYSSINCSTDDEEKFLKLNLTIPLLSGINEIVCIKFKRNEKKNIRESYKKLREKYLNVKRFAEENFISNDKKLEKIKKEINNK